MLKKWIRRIALSYVRKSMSHENRDDRDAVFAAINEGMRREFSEDNIHTRVYSVIGNLLRNDPEFQHHAEMDGIMEKTTFVDTMAAGARSEVLSTRKELGRSKFGSVPYGCL